MQPYFFPYIGYFQLINLVDEFIIYDNIEFTKKGWINRNRVLVNGEMEHDHISRFHSKKILITWTSERDTCPIIGPAKERQC